jgi:2,3-bisphosphoglycerate-independent phosphoglycerate mutase
VPLLLVSENDHLRLRPNGSLRDIAPTMLSALREKIPPEMTGKDLRIS